MKGYLKLAGIGELELDGLRKLAPLLDDVGMVAVRAFSPGPKPMPQGKKKVSSESLAGGNGDYRPDSDFSQKQVAKGEEIEMEHTNTPDLAREIARDHLSEIPDYYTRLEAMEEGAKEDGQFHEVEKKIQKAEQSAAEKVAFGFGPEVQVPAELLSTVGGLYAGHGMGKSLAGETAAAVAPHGKMLRTEEKARRAATFAAPIAGLAALALARKYGLAGKAADYLAKKAPGGLIANPQLEQEAVRMATPFVAGLGGSALGGLGTGAALGAAAHLTPSRGGSVKKEAGITPEQYREVISRPEHQPGMVERHAYHTGLGAGGIAGALGGSALARKAGLGLKGQLLTGALTGIGGSLTAGSLGASAESAKRSGRLDSERKAFTAMGAFKPSAPAVKQASLNQALGSLYTKYGPPLQKHAAATFFNYSVDKDRLDQEALGRPFCKIASASGVDPWDMALMVVKGYPSVEKMAAAKRSQEQELASFYVSWANDMLKKAGLLDSGIKAVRAVKAGVGAAIPKSSKTLANQAIHAAETAGAAIPGPRQGVIQSVKGSLAHSNTLQQAGGGSIRRGEQLAKADPGILQATQHPVMHPGTPPAAAGGAAPARAGVKVKATKPSELGNYLRGAGVLGGLGLGGAAMMSGGEEPQQAYGEYNA